MRVLVTGSQGYLGSVLTAELVRCGYHCVGLDTGFFKGALLHSFPEITTIVRDARDVSEEDLRGFDVVVHLAGISNDPMGAMDPSMVYDPTRKYSLKIAELCKKMGVRFIFASSCSVYGIGGEERLTEEAPVNPQTGYSQNKYQIEQDLQAISDGSFSPIALRFATVFGSSPRIRFDVVVNMLVGMAVVDGLIVLNSDGKAWRPNLHILDACKAIMCAIDCGHRSGDLLIVNVGSDANNLQVIQIARTIQRLIPTCELRYLAENSDLDRDNLIRDRKVNQGKGDTRTYQVSFEKIAKVFPGFQCDWDVERGVTEMVERFRAAGLDREKFKSRGYYRLQQLEKLLTDGSLSPELRWVDRSAVAG